MDLYATLGVGRTADEAEIKKAYRSLAKQLHPDRNKDNPEATERFGKVTQAYDILTDKDKRARYDRGEIDEDGNPRMPFGYGGAGAGFGGSAGGYRQGGGPEGFDFASAADADLSDLFDGLFGGGRRAGASPGGGFGGFGSRTRAGPPPRGADIAYRLEVPFEDAATLKEQRVTLRGGNTVDIRLPKGLNEETKIRLSGKGEAGPGGNGDAIVTIVVQPHAFYTRDGDAIRLDLPVSIDEAVLGGKVKVPTVDGPVMLNVPAGASSGKTLRLKGKGFTARDGTRGDQLVTLMIDVPQDDEALKSFLESWEGKGRSNPRAALGV